MSGDDTSPTSDDEQTTPTGDIDPAGLKDALGRTGRMLKTAGLPFEDDEFDGDGEDDDDDSSSTSSGTADADAAGSPAG